MRILGEGDGPIITIEIQLRQGTKLIVSGRGGAEAIAEAIKTGLRAAKLALESEEGIQGLMLRERRFPSELLDKVGELSNRDLVLLLLYYEGPMGREQINQRTKEIGKEVSKSWLDTSFFRKPIKDLFVAETGPDGTRLYRLSELGRVEAEKMLAQLSGGVS